MSHFPYQSNLAVIATLQTFFLLIFTGGNRNKKHTTGVPNLVDDCYFRLIEKNDRGWTAACKTCEAVVKGALSINSNLVRHLSKRHPEVLELYRSEMQEKRKERFPLFRAENSQTFDPYC